MQDISNRCECEYCQLSRRIQEHFPDSSTTPEQKNLLSDLWVAMETNGLDLSVMRAKADGSWPKDENDKDDEEAIVCLI